VELFCPNCSAELKGTPAECWNCGAIFSPGSVWVPVDRPLGVFEKRDQAPAKIAHAAAASDVLVPGRLLPLIFVLPLLFALVVVVIVAATMGTLRTPYFLPALFAFAAGFCYAVSLGVFLPVIILLRIAGKLRFGYYIGAVTVILYLLSQWFVRRLMPFELLPPNLYFWAVFLFWLVFALLLWTGAPATSSPPTSSGRDR
jgi:hypothetical protein